jgi:hypothetical protein
MHKHGMTNTLPRLLWREGGQADSSFGLGRLCAFGIGSLDVDAGIAN